MRDTVIKCGSFGYSWIEWFHQNKYYFVTLSIPDIEEAVNIIMTDVFNIGEVM